MPLKCIVKGCKSFQLDGSESSDIKFYAVPYTDYALCHQWLRLSGREEEIGMESTSRFKHWKICSLHFNAKHLHLKTMMPTLHLPAIPRKHNNSEQSKLKDTCN